MASGGWLGNIVSAPLKLVGSLLGGDDTVSASSSVYPTVTARDLVPSTEATAPQAPVMGNDNSYPTGAARRKKGLSGLYVEKNDNNYTGVGGL